MYEQTREHFEKSAGVTPHDVLVLRGGFTQFQTKFRVSVHLSQIVIVRKVMTLKTSTTQSSLRTGTQTFGLQNGVDI